MPHLMFHCFESYDHDSGPFALEYKFFLFVYKPIDSYLSFFSIYQDWMMFAPDPGRVNSSIDAQVEFDDGTTEMYSFPISAEMSLVGKYMRGEKIRKIISEGIRKDSHSFLWRDTAKYVLRELKEKNFNKIPLKVHLIRLWDYIPDYDKEFRLHSEAPKKFQQFRFYTYEVI